MFIEKEGMFQLPVNIKLGTECVNYEKECNFVIGRYRISSCLTWINYVVVQIFLCFENFQTSLIFIFLCLRLYHNI